MMRYAAARLAAAYPPVAVGAMGDREQRRKTGGGRQRDGLGEDGAEAAFDLWLQRNLHQLYDNVAQEPLPPELLRLIEEDRKNRNKSS
ncbi:hypothetical protein [Crenalkalicoccus roseus]|uniref:hypothetical protein n=1 Tax=Crenalkalicoccus roseus TaxID=1485588 RepID=UPI00108134F4|nr:hypothetical protein [Crenalkalicoccus roseus]